MNKVWSFDNTKLVVLLFITIFVVYMQPALSHLYFIVLVLLAYRSNNSYFWLAFIFVLLQAPGGLFSAGARDDMQRLPLFSLGPGLSFTTFEIFMVVLLFKALLMRSEKENIFKRDFTVLAFVIIFYFLFSIFIGLSERNLMLTLRGLLSWTWLIIIPTLLDNREDVRKLMQLLFPIVILAFASQVYTYITGFYFDDILRGTDPGRYARQIDDTSQIASRVMNSPYLILICFAMALYYIIKNDKSFPSAYLFAILFISCFTIFLSATRGWMIAFTGMLLLALSGQGTVMFKKAIGIFIVSMVILYFLMLQFPFLERQMELSLERARTMEQLVGGDVTAGGTLGRIDQRGPRVLSIFNESPLFGFGFSDDFREYFDDHVGHHSLLLNVGILGYALVMGIFLKWIIMFYRIPFQLKKSGYSGGGEYHSFGIMLIGILIIHSTSTQFIGFYFVFLYKYFVYALLFGLFIPLYNSDLKSSEYSDK